tara:strand:+ start:1002 stop:2738 length:1737 start_codon:yes stop_codon:yes gene_type:complete
MVTLEVLLDKIAEELILSTTGVVTPDVVSKNQKTIRQGVIQLSGENRTSDERLVLYQKDVEANRRDLLSSITVLTDGQEEIITLQSIANEITSIESVQVTIAQEPTTQKYLVKIYADGLPTNGRQIDFIVNQADNNPLNVSQFIPIRQLSSNINVEQAEEFLDTNIFELLPTGDTRQRRIIRFFDELNALLPPIEPDFDKTDSEGNPPGDGRVDRNEDGDWSGADEYSQNNSIAYAQENVDGNINEEDAFIHRIKNLPTGQVNENYTIEDIYNTILPYLTDILEDELELEDDRPEYQNQSSGFLKFRDLNQGIIIRNTNQDFIEGLDPNNPTYLNTDGTGGFTITMWVRFLDKVSEGTLFNFGNPLREDNPFGFSLETYVINADDTPNPSGFTGGSGKTWGQIFRDGGDDGTITYENGVTDVGQGFFNKSNTERFVRLVVREAPTETYPRGVLRDSHLGAPWMMRYPNTPQLGFNHTSETPSNPEFSHHFGLMKNTRIPEDFNEWYFICATYNPNVNEEYGFLNQTIGDYNNVRFEPNFWLNHIDANGEFTNFSGFGNKCKVEIISRSDLLRAQGFKV